MNPDSGSVTLVDARAHQTIAEIKTGIDPWTVTFTPDGALTLVVNRGSDSLTVIDESETVAGEVAFDVGAQPYGVVSDGARAFISLFALGRVAVVDLATRTVSRTIEVGPFPAGLALAVEASSRAAPSSRDAAPGPADGSTLYVTHLYSGEVSVIDLRTFSVKRLAAASPESNLAQFIALSPDGARAYLPLTLSHSGNTSLSYDSTVIPAVAMLDTTTLTFSTPLDLSRADRPVNLPYAAAVSLDGHTLYVANAGSDDVSLIDLESGRATAHLSVGRNPRGLALSPDGAWLYVNNVLDGSLDIFDASPPYSYTLTLTLTHIPLPLETLIGQRLFNSALDPMSHDHWLSCATCHFDGGMDARTWRGFPDGPRNTPALFGAARSLPLHWSGDLDELQDVELTIRNIQGGAGLIEGEVNDSLGAPTTGHSASLDALAAYLATLSGPPSPYLARGQLSETIQRGAYAFRRWGCSGCHSGTDFTDDRLHLSSIGDAALEHNAHGRGMNFDTPSLLGVWATAPYFHDGSAATLRDTFFATGFHRMGYAMDQQEAEDLVAYLESLAYNP